jgi:hypothetical protein
MKTIKQIIEEVRAVTGSYSEATFRRDAARFGVKPMTEIRFHPRAYPDDATVKILKGRGFAPVTIRPAITTSGVVVLPSMKQLRNERKKARGAK